MDFSQWISLGASLLVVGFFALRALLYYNRASMKLTECTRTWDYLIASLDENREPDLTFDRKEVSKKLREFQGVIGAQASRPRKMLKVRRSSLDDTQYILDNLERAKMSTEVLPLCGILGTACGFLMSNYMGTTKAAVGQGLWLALVSTILALGCTILLKWGYEGRLIPQFGHYLNQLGAIELSIQEGGIEILERFWIGEPGMAPAAPPAEPGRQDAGAG